MSKNLVWAAALYALQLGAMDRPYTGSKLTDELTASYARERAEFPVQDLYDYLLRPIALQENENDLIELIPVRHRPRRRREAPSAFPLRGDINQITQTISLKNDQLILKDKESNKRIAIPLPENTRVFSVYRKRDTHFDNQGYVLALDLRIADPFHRVVGFNTLKGNLLFSIPARGVDHIKLDDSSIRIDVSYREGNVYKVTTHTYSLKKLNELRELFDSTNVNTLLLLRALQQAREEGKKVHPSPAQQHRFSQLPPDIQSALKPFIRLQGAAHE